MMAETLSMLINNLNEIPEWIAESITDILPQTKQTGNPIYYMSIIWLFNTNDLITFVLTHFPTSFLYENVSLPLENKGS